jgi:hypothetical protein
MYPEFLNAQNQMDDCSGCVYSDKIMASLCRKSFSFKIKMEKAEYRNTGGVEQQ